MNKELNQKRKAVWKKNRLERQLAWHRDCISWQGERQSLTPKKIAKQEWYKTYVRQNVERHERYIDMLLDQLDELEGVIPEEK